MERHENLGKRSAQCWGGPSPDGRAFRERGVSEAVANSAAGNTRWAERWQA